MCVQCSPDFRGEMLTAHDRRTTHPETRELYVGVSHVSSCVVCVSADRGRDRRVASRGKACGAGLSSARFSHFGKK